MDPALSPALLHVLAPIALRLFAIDPGGDLLDRAAAAAAGEPRADGDAVFIGVDGEVVTAGRVRRFLAARGSPLAERADRIVAAGVRHGVDPRWVVAIAGTESNFGIEHHEHNAWGWSPRDVLSRWASWEESIEAYTRHFARGYRVREPHRIGARYAPYSKHWAATTRRFFEQI